MSPKHPKLMMPVYVVEWLDACFYDQERDDNVLPVPMMDVGFLIKETPDYVQLAYEIHADGHTRHKIVIPKTGMSPLTKQIGQVRIPDTFLTFPDTADWVSLLGHK